MALRATLPRALHSLACARGASATAGAALKSLIDSELAAARAAGTYKRERVITTPQRSSIGVATSATPVLNFCANNYLGLSDNARLIRAAQQTMDSHGLGLSSVRFICGTQDIHKTLERKIAAFHGMDDAILYAACFDANGGLFEALFGPEDALLSDELNHASIIDGMRLCKSTRKLRYKHLDMHDLEERLKATQDARQRVIVTDGVFSMDGDIAPLDAICALADRYKALVMIDECHATGFLGRTGRGTDEYCGVRGRVDIINSTLGKALGGASGGYTAAAAHVVDMLRQRSRPYLFSNTLAPAIVGASIACLDMLSADSSFVAALQANVRHFRDAMTALGFKIGGKDHPIAPVLLGDARLAGRMAERMLEEGIYVVAFSFPVVPKDKARIRVQLSSAHTPAQVQQLVDAFAKVGRELNVIA